MGRGVKVVLIHVKVLLYHRSDMVHDELRRETDEKFYAQGQYIYFP